MKPVLNAKVKNCGLIYNDPIKLANSLVRLEGEDVKVVISKKTTQRTLDQNSYYWVLVEILGNELGYFRNEMHDALRQEFLLIREDGKMPYTKSTTDLDTKGFGEYIDKIKIWASVEHSIVLPDAKTVIDWG